MLFYMCFFTSPHFTVQVEFEYDPKDVTAYLEARADLVPEKHVPDEGWGIRGLDDYIWV